MHVKYVSEMLFLFNTFVQLEADEYGMVRYVLNVNKTELRLSPEEIGSVIIKFLKGVAERNLTAPASKCVMSVPAEFDERQRNYTKKAGSIAGTN